MLWNRFAGGQKPAAARLCEWSRGPGETGRVKEAATGWREISVAEVGGEEEVMNTCGDNS